MSKKYFQLLTLSICCFALEGLTSSSAGARVSCDYLLNTCSADPEKARCEVCRVGGKIYDPSTKKYLNVGKIAEKICKSQSKIKYKHAARVACRAGVDIVHKYGFCKWDEPK